MLRGWGYFGDTYGHRCWFKCCEIDLAVLSLIHAPRSNSKLRALLNLMAPVARLTSNAFFKVKQRSAQMSD